MHFSTLIDTPTLGRTTLDERSASRQDLYLTTPNTHKRDRERERERSIPQTRFETAISARE